ncbi:MAG: amidase [Myxococcota bacterium]|nr:amidase [Myxococcota bacterium]
MPISRPSRTALATLAESLGFHLEGAELDQQAELVGTFIGAFDRVEALPEPERPVPARREHCAPDPEENPHGAWVRRTSVREREGGRLAGRRVALKDNIALAGVPMSGGTSFLQGYVPEQDATVVRRVLDEGGEIVGKAACEYLSLSAGSHTSSSGVVHNPRDPSRSTGGSSSGCAAALAAGEVDFAIGGDQGGSIRFPAAHCGIVGLKPTHGLVPYTGILSIDAHLDHTGPMTTNVADNALLLEVIAGPDGIDTRQQYVRTDRYAAAAGRDAVGLRVGVLEEGFPDSVEPGVERTVRASSETLAGAGAHVEAVSIPSHPELGAAAVPFLILGGFELVCGGGFATHANLPVPFGLAEAFERWHEHADAMPANVKSMLLAGAIAQRSGSRPHYAKALRLRAAARAAYDQALRSLDALLMPTTTCTAPPLPAPDANAFEVFAAGGAGIANTSQFDVSGHPAISVPCGEAAGLPVGCMLVARHCDEAILYRLAAAIERG